MSEEPLLAEAPPAPTVDFDPVHLSRTEYITSLVHFYRGEIYRSTAWRLRLDTTTNWSIFSVMALVTFSLGENTHSHVGILAGMILVLTFLAIEARRFRFYDVWRRRARILEENFIAPILRRNLVGSVTNWGNLVAEELLRPRFRISFFAALRLRLVRNYIPLFALLLLCWFLKLNSQINDPQANVTSYLEAMRIGDIPGWMSLLFVAALYGFLAGVALIGIPPRSTADDLWPGDRGRIADIDF